MEERKNVIETLKLCLKLRNLKFADMHFSEP